MTDQLKLLLEAGFQANDTVLAEEDGKWTINGEPTDGAFLTLYRKVLGVDYQSPFEPLDLLPFDSDYRYIAELTKDQTNGRPGGPALQRRQVAAPGR